MGDMIETIVLSMGPDVTMDLQTTISRNIADTEVKIVT